MAPIDATITVWSFGNDMIFMGVRAGTTIKEKHAVSIYTAYEQSYIGGKNGANIDFSYGYKAYSNEKFDLSFGARSRTRTSDLTTELRPQIDMSGRINKDMSWYATIYDREIFSFMGNPNKNTHGAFAGLSYDTGWGSVKGEFQVDSRSGASCNFGMDIKINNED